MNAPERLPQTHDRQKYIGGSTRVPAMTAERVSALYEKGMTQAEIAQEIGTSQRSVCLFMKRAGIAARVASKRDQRGEKNSTWKGENVTYKPAHSRVYAARGRPSHCEHCGTTNSETRYEWANVSGKYHDPADYLRLCVKCHRRWDAQRRKEGKA